jgi:hypothetical protein
MTNAEGKKPGHAQGSRAASEQRSPQQTTSGRRRFLVLGIASAAATLTGCDFFDYYFHSTPKEPPAGTLPSAPSTSASPTAPTSAAPAPSPAPDPTALPWAPNPTFVQGSTVPFDLATTLPTGVARGGVFTIDSTGASLPTGVTMTSNGLLYAGTASVGTTTGVVFRYSEPS